MRTFTYPIIFLVAVIVLLGSPLTSLALPVSQSQNNLEYGDSVNADLTSSTGDQWTFAGNSGDIVQIAMNGSSLNDTYLELLDPEGDEITSDDDGGPGYFSLISDYSLPASGTYTIIARGYRGLTGRYTLSLEETGESNSEEDNALAIRYGESKNDSATSSRGDRWTFSGSAGDVITIAMNGISLSDTYLELLDPSDNEITSDDDGGGGYFSLIDTYVLPISGTYTIVARGYDGATGTYNLTLAGTEEASVPDMSGPPAFAAVEHLACGSTETYFVVSYDPEAAPHYDYYSISIEAQSGAEIEHVLPIPESELTVERLLTMLVVLVGEEELGLPGIGTLMELTELILEEMDRQSRTGINHFELKWFDSSQQFPVVFIVFATHNSSGGIEITEAWQRSASETTSSRVTQLCN